MGAKAWRPDTAVVEAGRLAASGLFALLLICSLAYCSSASSFALLTSSPLACTLPLPFPAPFGKKGALEGEPGRALSGAKNERDILSTALGAAGGVWRYLIVAP